MKCQACGGTVFLKWECLPPHSILKCGICGLGVTSPAPSKLELSEFNRNIYNGEQRAILYSARKKEFKKRYSAQITRIKRFKPGGALLDVGCNIGMFMKAARDEGFAVTGIEMNTGCAAYGRDNFGLDIRSIPFEDAVFTVASFDVVTMFDVLEHVPDPETFLSVASRALKPGGLLVVQSPNFDSIMAGLLKERWNWLTPLDHLYHFTPGALARLLKNRGFNIAEMRTWEPAGDFIGNIYSGFSAGGVAGRVFRKFIWLAALALVPLLQRLWWRFGRGGLVEVYALKA